MLQEAYSIRDGLRRTRQGAEQTFDNLDTAFHRKEAKNLDGVEAPLP